MPPRKKRPLGVQQTAIGDGNIQIVGDQNVVNQTIIQRISNFFAGDTEAQRAQRNRHAMLELVKNTWIKGVLEKSLYNEVLIELGLEERPGAVEHPWDVQLQMPDQTNCTLPPGTPIMQVFDEMNGAMLILGEPGSGKTTMLLELARECTDRASQGDDRPIPVVFNLSSWGGKQNIDEWLVGELNTKYHVSKKIAQGWVSDDDLHLLLDGLDEVKQENRDECVKAINDFRQTHGLAVPIAVCSRLADYEALTTKLDLQGAIVLQPLTSEQIDKYFDQASSELAGVHQALKNDKTLQELVKLPLILSIVMMVYRGKAEDAIRGDYSENPQNQRKVLFDNYIQQMFERIARTKSDLYTAEQTRQWLTWLAQKMIKHNAVPYVLENMQQEWLGRRQQEAYLQSVGNAIGVIFGLSFGLLFGLWRGLNWGLGVGVLGWLIVWMLGSQPDYCRIQMVDSLMWEWKKARRGFIIGLTLWLISAFVLAIFSNHPWLALSGTQRLELGLIGLLLVFFIGLRYGLTAKPISQTIIPGQRIARTLRTFLFASCLLGLSFGLITVLAGVLIGAVPPTFYSTLFIVLLGSAERFGGMALAKYYILHSIISRNKYLPWRLIPFLDYCVDRIFLRRVGGGYIFIHRLLMEHFAAMYQEEPK